MADYDRMLKRAEQLERLADEVFSPEHRRELLQIANEWREIAARAERAGRPVSLAIPEPRRPN